MTSEKAFLYTKHWFGIHSTNQNFNNMDSPWVLPGGIIDVGSITSVGETGKIGTK